MEDSSHKVGESTGKRAGNRGLGRKKGSENRIPKTVKEMILAALENVGGLKYLEEQAKLNPVAFLTLVGKLLPLELSGKATVTYKLINAIPEERSPLVIDAEGGDNSSPD